MTNADNYTDTTDTDFKGASYNIDTGKNLSATGMRAALHTKENVANKQGDSMDADGTLTSSSSDSYYPSSKLVGKNLGTLRSDKQDKIPAGTANDILTKTTTAGTLGTLTKTTTVAATASASDDNIPTEKAIATALSGKLNASDLDTLNNDVSTLKTTVADLQAKLPIGTILIFNGIGWQDNVTMVGWYKCVSANSSLGVPNLESRFIMGSTASGQTGGSDSVTLTAANLPSHSHTFTGDNKTGQINIVSGGFSVEGVFSRSATQNNHITAAIQGTDDSIAFSMTPSGSVTGGGGSPQTAVAIVPKYYAVIYVMKVL
ncbi:MAG: hypothetical protein LBK68_00085 [Candidatus Margulisbacteria bacterium]|nr:hypothetical protein [Candidatus Margulisiibacteriota bacterium]